MTPRMRLSGKASMCRRLRDSRCPLTMLLLSAWLLWSGTVPAAEEVGEPQGYWEGDINAPTPSTLRGGRVIHVAELQALLRQGTAVLIDVSGTPRRPAELAPGAPWLPVPHQAIPGALWFPGVGSGRLSPEVEDFYRARL